MIPSIMLASLMAVIGAAGPASSLPEAAMHRDMAAVRSLLTQKVDVNAPGKDGTPALHWVVRVDDIDTAKLLIKAGANVRLADRYGVTPIFLACANGNAAMIQLLLDSGADPNTVDPAGETALMTAAKVGDVASVRVLADAGAKIDTRDPAFQQTALMMAVRGNRTEVVRFLVERHADVNAQTRTGQAPG